MSIKTAAEQPAHTEGRDIAPEEIQIQELFQIPTELPPSYAAQPAHAIKPVALPRTSPAFDSPFARAYAPGFEAYGITQEKWLEFVDGLSYAMISSAPLQVLGTAGKVLGVVPFGPALMSGINTSAAAQAGQRVFSKTLTDKYLKRANDEFFGIRGLRVRLMQDEALKVFCGSKSEASESSTMGKIGKKAEAFFTTVRLPIVTPIASAVLDAVKPLPPPSSPLAGEPTKAFAEKKIAALQPHVAPVSFDVPSTAMPQGFREWAAAYAAQRKQGPVDRRVILDDRRQALASISRGETTARGYTQSLQASSAPTRRGLKDERKAIRRAYKQERRAMQGRSNGKVERRANMAERRDLRRDEKLVWLVVYPVARDAEIVGREELDSESPLQMSDGEYQEELEAYMTEEEDQAALHEAPPPYRSI